MLGLEGVQQIIEEIERRYMKQDIPEFRVGDTV
ncbi:MAG: 50S ribosomal protein L19, partial [Chloroflexaceae bacterium]